MMQNVNKLKFLLLQNLPLLLSRFILNYGTLTEPLRKLTKKDVKWTWTDDQQSLFLKIKEAIMSSHVMSYFDHFKDTETLQMLVLLESALYYVKRKG